jgi:hypothetical protein
MGSKRSHNYIARLVRHTPKKNFLKIGVYQSLNLMACYLYTLSLEGGDVEYLLSRVGYFAGAIISSLTLSIVVGLVNFYTSTGYLRIINFLIQFITIAFTVTRDLGTDLQSHGQYNLLVYCLLTMPVIFSFLLLKSCVFVKQTLNNWKL